MLAFAFGLSACAGGLTPAPVKIDYRANRPQPASSGAKTASQGNAAQLKIPTSGKTSSPAVAEAQALKPEQGQRPGGSRRLPKDDARNRAVTVQKGDRLYDVSRRYSVQQRALIETNRLDAPYALKVGSTLYLPPPNVHVVARGETLFSISRRFNIDTRSLAVMNGLERPWVVYPGDEILLPPLASDGDYAPAQPVVQTAAKSTPKVAPKAEPEIRVEAAAPGTFIWPVDGQVISRYGAADGGLRNDGVNIAARAGSDVRASAAGQVVYAGDELEGFGNLLLIQHPNGWVSAYAHSERLVVKNGDRVTQGQVIAKVGSTGSVDRAQVHFELRRGKTPVDPAEHLPAARS